MELRTDTLPYPICIPTFGQHSMYTLGEPPEHVELHQVTLYVGDVECPLWLKDENIGGRRFRSWTTQAEVELWNRIAHLETVVKGLVDYDPSWHVHGEVYGQAQEILDNPWVGDYNTPCKG